MANELQSLATNGASVWLDDVSDCRIEPVALATSTERGVVRATAPRETIPA